MACDFWDGVEAARINATVGGEWEFVANATSSGGTSSTSSGLMATGTATGNGNMVRTAFLFSLFTALAMVFSVVLAF